MAWVTIKQSYWFKMQHTHLQSTGQSAGRCTNILLQKVNKMIPLQKMPKTTHQQKQEILGKPKLLRLKSSISASLVPTTRAPPSEKRSGE